MPHRAIVFLLVLTAAVSGQSPKEVRKVAKQGESAIPELRRFLLNPDEKVRLEAVHGLIDISGQQTLDPLADATRDNDPQVQILAVNGLVNFYKPGYVKTGFAAPIRRSVSGIASKFNDPDDAVIDPYVMVRPGVIQAIGGVARAGSSLDSRANAARAIGVLRGRAAVPDLIQALQSRDTDVIMECLVAFQKIGDARACAGIHFLTNDLNPKVQSQAIETDGTLRCVDTKQDIRSVLSRTDDRGVQRAALTALAMMPDAQDRPTFASYLNSTDERLRTAAAEGFARLASIDDARQLQTAFDKEERIAPRLGLAFALVMDGNLSTADLAPLSYLIGNLNSAATHQAAETYLTEAARNPEVRKLLYASLDSDTRDEKIGIARVIAAAGDRGGIPTLEKLSHDPDSTVAQEGLRQLRNLQAKS